MKLTRSVGDVIFGKETRSEATIAESPTLITKSPSGVWFFAVPFYCVLCGSTIYESSSTGLGCKSWPKKREDSGVRAPLLRCWDIAGCM